LVMRLEQRRGWAKGIARAHRLKQSDTQRALQEVLSHASLSSTRHEP